MKKAQNKKTQDELALTVATLELAFQKLKGAEALAIYNLEKKNLKNRNNNVYVAMENAKIDWFWNGKQVGWADDMWKAGVSLMDMALALERKPVEVFLLIMSREIDGKIKPRQNGIWG